MEKGRAIACGIAVFSASWWALSRMFSGAMEQDTALLASFILALFSSAFFSLIYKSTRSSPKAVLTSGGVIAFLGTFFPYSGLPCPIGLALVYGLLAAPLLAREERISYEKLAELSKLWEKFRGILTISAVLEHLGVSVEEAEELLGWYCRRGLARKLVREGVILYCMPSVVEKLPPPEAVILRAFLEKPTGLTEEELSSLTGLRTGVLKLVLDKLVNDGLLVKRSDEYKLVVVHGFPEARRAKRKRKKKRGKRRRRKRARRP